MPVAPSATSGYFLLADVTGYTSFLTRTELDHAQEVLAGLFGAILAHVRTPFRIVEVEGDAVFGYAPDRSVRDGGVVVDIVESAYCAFVALRERMHRSSTCTCTACRLIPELDLKFAVHHGAFVLDRHLVKHEAKPTGPDVILVHRLLKNAVRERTGVHSYALFTDAAVRAGALEEFAAGLRAHAEDYEHLGRVSGVVHDLSEVWAREHERRRVRVEPEAAWLVHETVVPVGRERMWELLTEPHHKKHWRGALAISVAGNPSAPVGMGTVHHCAHGDFTMVEEVVDWRPLHYVTYEQVWPMGARVLVTNQLDEVDGKTRVSSMTSRPRGLNLAHDLAVVRPVYLFMKRQLNAATAKFITDLHALAMDPAYKDDV